MDSRFNLVHMLPTFFSKVCPGWQFNAQIWGYPLLTSHSNLPGKYSKILASAISKSVRHVLETHDLPSFPLLPGGGTSHQTGRHAKNTRTPKRRSPRLEELRSPKERPRRGDKLQDKVGNNVPNFSAPPA